MKAVLLVLLLFLPLSLDAAPIVKSPGECVNLSDVALVARALAVEGLDAPQSRQITRHIYLGLIPDTPSYTPDFVEIRDAIVSVAQRDKRGAGDFARDFLAHCRMNRGNMDGFLGVAL